MRSLLFSLLIVAACASSTHWEAVPRPVRDLPDAFVTESGAPLGGPWCTVRLKDPRDGTPLRLVQSTAVPGGAIGNYAVSVPGRYGLTENEVLRLDCLTGKARGAVPR